MADLGDLAGEQAQGQIKLNTLHTWLQATTIRFGSSTQPRRGQLVVAGWGRA